LSHTVIFNSESDILISGGCGIGSLFENTFLTGTDVAGIQNSQLKSGRSWLYCVHSKS